MRDVAIFLSVHMDMRFLVRAYLLICFFSRSLLIEREEAAVEIPEGNTTAGADVDKRVKRRLLMGKSAYPK